MASDRIKYSDIFDPKALETAIEETKKLQKELESASLELKEMVKTSAELAKIQNKTFDNAEKIRETEKAINDTVKATEQLDKVEKKRLKLEADLLELEDKRVEQNALLAEKLRQQRKALRDNAKEALNTRNAYQNLTKATNEAQMEFKRLAVEFGINSKEAKEAHKVWKNLDDDLREINDAAKDGRRDVGRYEKVIESLKKEFPRLSKNIDRAGDAMDNLTKAANATGVIMLLTKLFEGLQNVLGNNSQAGATLEKVMGRVTITFTVLLSRLTKALPIALKIAKGLFNDLSSSVQKAFLNVQISILETTQSVSLGLQDNTEKIEALKKQIDSLNKSATITGATFENLADVFEGTGAEIENTIDKNDKLIDTTLKYRRQNLALQKDINNNLKLQAQLQAAADNENNSLLDRIENQEELIRVTEFIQGKELEQVKLREELARQNAAIFKDSVEAQEEYSEATKERIALEVAQEEELFGQKRELQTLERDQLEQELDFLIDNFDNQKTINERIIADEQTTFKEKERLLKENKRLADESYEAQIKLFNIRAEKMGKEQLNLEELVKESDSRIIAEKAKNAGIDEALLIRVLEVIRERRTVNQDLVESQKDLNEATKESNKLEQETALNLQAVNELKEKGADVEKVLEKLEDERLKQTIKNLRLQIALLKKNTPERIKLEKELSEALLTEQQRRLKKEEEAEEKAIERRKELQEAAASTLEKLAQKTHEKRLNRIESLLEAEQKRADELRELARQGVQDAQNNLAENQKRQAELERQREKELKRQKQFELALAAARAYSANVAAGEKNPLAKTLTDVTLLEAFIESLTGFYHGTEDTGTKGPLSDEYGVITGYTHANERVMTAEQNSFLPKNLSNWELVRLANMNQEQPKESTLLVAGLQDVKRAIEKKPSYLGRDYSATERAVIDTYHEKGRILRKHYKRGGLISKRK
jgi:hypothetical protein